jgi:hypothetical protein
MTRGFPLAALVLAGCAAPAPLPVGDDGWGPSDDHATARPPLAAAPRARTIPAAKRKRWSGADGLSSLHAIALRTPSEHLDGRFERTVLVNDLANAYERLAVTTIMPKGALVVQRHHLRGSDETSVYFVMEKTSDDDTWRFLVVDAQLRVAAHAALDACARCHVEAPHRGLFGVAVPSAPSP